MTKPAQNFTSAKEVSSCPSSSPRGPQTSLRRDSETDLGLALITTHSAYLTICFTCVPKACRRVVDWLSAVPATQQPCRDARGGSRAAQGLGRHPEPPPRQRTPTTRAAYASRVFLRSALLVFCAPATPNLQHKPSGNGQATPAAATPNQPSGNGQATSVVRRLDGSLP